MIHQLYGEFDAETKNWTDGIMSNIMREYSEDPSEAVRKWIIFDGPVDPEWVENLNTVMDDNRKLCLTSGEIIRMTKWMNFIFEVEDLAHATPATVSRLGIVFMEARNLGWEVIVQSFFLKEFPPVLIKYKEFIKNHIEYCLSTSLKWIKKYGVFPMQYSEV